MKYLGLLKWFDDVRGFGKIGTPDNGDVFIHQNNFAERPEKLLKATSLLFETKKDNRGISAINAKPPSFYEDFKTILSYLKKNPSISIEVTITGKSRWGNQYKRNEFKSYNLVECSLHQLLRKKQAPEIFEFFKNYFDEQYPKEGSEFGTKYFEITKEKIKGLKLELNDSFLAEFESKNSKQKDTRILAMPTFVDSSANNFLIQKLFAYYLTKADAELLFEVWKNKTHLINSSSFNYFGEDSSEEITFEFPAEIFLKNYSIISSHDLNRIISQSNGVQIITQIVKNKISNLEAISKNSVDEILKSIQIISKVEIVSELKELVTIKLLELLGKCDFVEVKKETIDIFKIFLEILKSKNNNLNYESTIQVFNESVSAETRFILWQATRYFQPEKDFFDAHFAQLSYSDFLNAPDEFHAEYFSNHLSKIEEFDTIENFCQLTFLIIETPHKVIQDIFPRLQLKYQAAYWLNFPKGDSYWGKYYQANYETADIPFKCANFISYLQNATSLSDLLLASELTNKIQERYRAKTSNHSNNEGFLKLDKQERNKMIQEFLLQVRETSSAQLVEVFKVALSKCVNEECVSLCKAFIPKFINEGVVNLDELIEIIRNIETDTKYRQAIFSYISEGTSKFERVALWFKGYTSKVDFNEVIEVFDMFQLNEQPNLLRKVFSLMQRNKITPVENCIAQLSTLATNQKLNLDVRICFTIIKSLRSEQNYIGENILSEIVCQYVNENVSEIVQIYDLFQECRGRTWMTVGDGAQKNWFLNIEGKEFPVDNDSVNVNGNHYSFDKEKRTVEIEGESYSFKWSKKENNLFGKLYDKPIGITFCDAVKSQKDETLNRNFYWCCNSKCYAPCQTDHIHLEWNKYSLRDFIKILKLPLEEDKFYRFVSVVNRANRLMKKLKCNSCNHLLRDTKTSEFAFYRVTTFHCTNSDCSELHKIVYLNHCLNWKCNNVVDSRISTTCPNGWYICDSCNNCCSQDKLEKRLASLITNNAFYPNNPRHQKLKHQVDNKLGHMEREEKFNYRTGERVNENSVA